MDLICSNCQTELPAGARFCMNCGNPVAGPTLDDERRRMRLASAAPQKLVEKARAANRLSGERRTVTALFIDVVGSRALAKELGQSQADEIIYAGLDLACPVIYKYEGTIAQLQDDELLVFFGAPVAHEDDPIRAVRAGLEISAAIQDYAQTVLEEHGVEYAVRITLSTGPVTIGPVDDNLRYEYSALGGTLNLAARLEATKLADGVLVSESTFQFIAPFCDCDDLGVIEIPAEGEQPGGLVRIYLVKGLESTPRQVRGFADLHSPMVGRVRELQMLVQLCRAVQAGLGRGVLIQGEPGMGKTRLIREWKARVDEDGLGDRLRWIEGQSHSYDQATAYHLVAALLRSLISIREGASEPETRAAFETLLESLFPSESERDEIYPFLGQILGLKIEGKTLEKIRHLEPQAHQNMGQNAMRRLLSRLSEGQPLVIVLEDLHWADPSSVNFLAPLLLLAATEPILFCLVTRTDPESEGWRMVSAAREALGGRLNSLNLKALQPEESRLLVSNLLQIEDLPSDVRDLILQRAEGNPFFMEEVVRMLIDRGAIQKVNGKWQSSVNIDEVDIPDNLQGLLSARIDRLPNEVKQTLRIAAVIGRQFPLRVLEHILNAQDSGQSE